MFHIILGAGLAAICGVYIFQQAQQVEAEQSRWSPPPVQDHVDALPRPDSNV